MDWKRAIAEERAALGRIVALLRALAGLAELAAGRSPIVRCLVLMVLRRADAIARDFVAGDATPMAVPVLPAGFSPTDALRLAQNLRALARELDRQARLLCRRDGAGRAELPCPGPTAAIRDLSDRLSAIMACGLGRLRPVLAPDTS